MIYKKLSVLGLIFFNFLKADLPTELDHLKKGTFRISEFPDELKHLASARSSENNDAEGTEVVSANLAEWTILVYMESENSLYSYAIRNIEDMVKANSSKNVNFLIQINKYKESKTHRLKVENHRLVDVGSFGQQMGLKPALELDLAIDWMAKKYPAKNSMVVLWNHGGGVNRWLLKPICWQGLETSGLSELAEELEAVNPPEIISEEQNSRGEKGILYNDKTGAYLSTNDLGTVIDKSKGYLGKNLSILAMDACLMAMIEVFYAVKSSCDIVVASENLERGEGWNYFDILNMLALHDGKVSAEELAVYIVESYKNYYINSDPEFTQSAAKMDKVDALKNAIDVTSEALISLRNSSKLVFQTFFESMYRYVIKYEKDYVDLGSVISSLDTICQTYISFYTSRPNPYYQTVIASLKKIQESLPALDQALQDAVLATHAGKDLYESQGISIYLPQIFLSKMVSEYSSCSFAKNSKWLQFLSLVSRQSLEEELETLHEGSELPTI